MANRKDDKQDKPTQSGEAPGAEVQGEGNYEASRRHQRAAHEFAASQDTEKLARDAAPRNAAEQEELERAEREGRSHAADEEEDLDISDNEPPAIKRDGDA
jgi:hypothetical protein